MNERVIGKYGRVRCINIFADYGFCVFHMCWPWFRRGQFSFSTIWFIWCCPYIIFAVFWNLTVFPVMFFSGNFFSSWNRFWKWSWFICKHINYAYLLYYVGLRFFGFHLLVILAIFYSYFWLIIWVSKLLAFSSADEELFSEMAIQDHRRMGHGFRFLLPLFSTTPLFSKFSYKSFLFQNFHNHSFFLHLTISVDVIHHE